MSREPSYYEIALTQRQVVVTFVIVLVCLVAAFFAGVWVGGGDSRGGTLPEVVAEVAEAGGEKGVPEAGGGEEEDGLRTLRFFGDDEGEAGAAPQAGRKPGEAPPPQPNRQTPPVQPAPEAGQQRPRAIPASPPAQETPARSSASPPAAGARPRQTPVQVLAVPAEPPVDPETVAPGQGGWVVQVFSSHDQAQSQELLDRLLRADFDAFLSPAEVAGVVRYRVRVGPFRTREEADLVAERLREEYHLETWVTH